MVQWLGNELADLLRNQLPIQGPLFSSVDGYLRKAAARFLNTHCRLVGIQDVNLHSDVPTLGDRRRRERPGGPAHGPILVCSICDQCATNGVPFFFKQWGGGRKSTTGRVLDGRTCDEFPRRSEAALPTSRPAAASHAESPWRRHRTKIFHLRCRFMGIRRITPHSHRYVWAERAKSAGCPDRFAQEALGHNSKAVHRAYARHAEITLPALEEHERKTTGRKVVTMRFNGAPSS